MIVVRDIFQLHFGRAREAIALAREGRELAQGTGYHLDRILTDVAGDYYTLVLESHFDDLAAFEQALGRETQAPGWREWYDRLVPLVRQGRREIFRVVE